MTLVRAFLDDTIADERWFLNQLGQQSKVDVDLNCLGQELFMTWDQARQATVAHPGLVCGAHGHSHQKLAALDEESQRYELTLSKRILEDRLGYHINALAYPYGWLGAYTDVTTRLAAESGYHIVFTARERVDQLQTLDRFEVGRLGVGQGDSPALLRGRAALQSAFGTSFL